MTPDVAASSSAPIKRKNEQSEPAHTQKKTKGIRKIQNGSAYAIEVNQVEVGDNSTGIQESEDHENEGDEVDEEEEVPDNLTFGEKTLGLLVEGMNKFQKQMLEFCAISSKQASTTNTIVSGLSEKLESTPLPASRGSSFSSSSSSEPSFSVSPSSGVDDSSAETSTSKVSRKINAPCFATSALAHSIMGAMPGIRQVFSNSVVIATEANVVVVGPDAAVDKAVGEVVGLDAAVDEAKAVDKAVVEVFGLDAAVDGRDAAVDRPDAAVVGPDAAVDGPNVVVDEPDAAVDGDDDTLDQDNRYDPGYHTLKHQLDTLLRKRIPRQFHHLSFKEMALVTQPNLQTVLATIDGKV